MPVWVILVVAGVLVLAALVLIIAVHILDVHAEQQCAQLHDLTQRSLQQEHNQIQTKYQYLCGESQLCCVCGSLRNRRLQVSNDNNTNSRGKSSARLSTAGLLQPLMDAAYGKSSLGSGSLECLSGLTSRRKRMTSGFQGGWFNGRSFFRGSGRSEEIFSGKPRGDCPNAPITFAAAASACSNSAAGVSAEGSGSDSMTTITATITTTSPPSSSLSHSSTGTQTSSGSGGNGVLTPIPQRRLVLEILMSPSGTSDGHGGTLPRATGVRLKLETNASLESLASLAAAASGMENSALGSQEPDAEAVASALTGLTSTSCGSIPACEASTDSSSSISGRVGASSRNSASMKSDDSQGDSASVSTVLGHKSDLVSEEVRPALCISRGLKTSTIVSTEDESGASRNGNGAGHTICSIPLDKRGAGFASPTTASSNSFAAVTCKTKSNGHTSGVSIPSKAKAKLGSCSTSAISSAVCGTSVGSNATSLRGSSNQACFTSILDGLGSLRISVLDGAAKGKSTKDSSKGVTAEIASALAALNVESIGGKGVGMGLTLGATGVLSDATCRVVLSEKVDASQEEEIHGDGSGLEQVVEDGDEQHPSPEAPEEGEGDSNKKEKRKKKNRGRRQKAKAAAVAAAAAGIEVQERPISGKHCIDALETANTAVEVEVGCICGTPKGACHSSSCPYPFTSSGSMVQRKIKEQYDELVRSNVAKTLTLAQVGRFTTCLVEAKSALQQKSDTIQRRFTIAKSLLSKADKSSFDRLCGQIYGLEIEQKKLEEDTVVYNRLQEHLKLSPAYQKMLEYGRTHFELQPNTGQLIEKVDSEDLEISFEELLAQEKKDSFWQKHGPLRSSMQVS